jgi:Terpene synthase family 2, C-terminal metal binding
MTTAQAMPLWDRAAAGTVRCPYPVRLGNTSQATAVELELAVWVRKHELVADEEAEAWFAKARFGYFASLVYPHVPDLPVYAKWIAWLFLFDDYFDENRGLTAVRPGDEPVDASRGLSRYLPIGHDLPAEPGSALEAALVDLWPELSWTMSPALADRFRRHADAYCASYATPLACARNESAPELSQYVALRRDSGAVETCLDLVERGARTKLPPSVALSPQTRALRRAANDVICWTNDLASLAKEVESGELNNLVAVLRDATGMDWRSAEEVACRMVDSRTREFAELCEHWTAGPHPQARAAFAEGVADWIAGSFQWHCLSPRYVGSVTCH